MKFLKTAIATTVLLATTTTAARADVFSGTHPKLGRVNLTMNSLPEPGEPEKDLLGFWYSIQAGNIRAFGKGTHRGDAYNQRKLLGVRIEDTDNYGEICRGTLGRSWVSGNTLGVVFEYDKGGTCPVAGESYQLRLYKQADNVGMAIGHSGNPVERIWLMDTLGDFQSRSSYVLPGDLLDVGESNRGISPVEINGIKGWLNYDQFLRNQRYPSWGV